jgi:hypothetical protein
MPPRKQAKFGQDLRRRSLDTSASPVLKFASPALLLWMGWLIEQNYLHITVPYGHNTEIFPALLSNAPAILMNGMAWHLIVLAAFWLLAVQIGRALTTSLGIAGLTPLEEILFASGLGVGAISLALFLMGVMGLWQATTLRWSFGLSTALSCLSLMWGKRRGKPGTSVQPAAAIASDFGSWEALAALMLACAVVMTLLCTSAPEIFYDSLVYHLSLPKLYLLNHRIIATPENVFSGSPQSVQMLYGLLLSLGDESLTSMLHWSFGVLTGLALWCLSCRYSRPSTGIMAAMIFFLSPLTMYAAACSGADLASSFFCLLAFFAFLRSTEDSNDSRRNWVVCTGVLIGLAMSTKYNVFILGAVLILIHAWLRRRDDPRDSMLMSLAAFLVLSPWLIKNVVFFGNPLYPFFPFLQLFHPHSAAPAVMTQELGARRDLLSFTTLAGWKDFILFSWSSLEGPMVMDNWLGPAFLMIFPWMLLRRWPEKPDRTAALCALGGYLAWSLTSTQGRFVLPALPIIAFAASLAVNDGNPVWVRRPMWAAAIILCFFNFQANCDQGVQTGRWVSLQRMENKASYLSDEHPTYPIPSYSAMGFINKELPSDAKILLVGESRGFYSDRNFVAASVFDSNPLWNVVRRAKSPEEIRKSLADAGFTHIFMNTKGLVFGTGAQMLPKTEIAGAAFGDFWLQYLDLLFEDRDPKSSNPRWLFVYKLRESPKEHPDSNFLNPPRLLLQTIAAAH